MPPLDNLKVWLEITRAKPIDRSDITSRPPSLRSEAMGALVRYVEDGAIAIDNNLVGKAVRSVAFGRKNRLLAGSDDDGEGTIRPL